MSQTTKPSPPEPTLRERLRVREVRQLEAVLALLAGLALCGFGIFSAIRGELVFAGATTGSIYRGTTAYLLAAVMIVVGGLCIRFALNPWRRENRELDDRDEWRLR